MACTARTAPANSSTVNPTPDAPTTKTPPPFELSFACDVEGNWSYFVRYLATCRTLQADAADIAAVTRGEWRCLTTLRLVHANAHFVFGGDAFDKGSGDIRFCESLLHLRERYPDRVHLVLGNRDLIKMMVTSEISPVELARPLASIPGPFWVKEGKRVSPLAYLMRRVGATDPGAPEVEAANTLVNRLRWLLDECVGCAGTFELRRQELALLRAGGGGGGDATAPVTDEEVCEHFRASVRPGGMVYRYLHAAKVAVRVGSSLFAHGAVNDDSLLFIPSPAAQHRRDGAHGVQGEVRLSPHDHGIDDWLDGLDAWKGDQLRRWRAQPEWDAPREAKGGEALTAYFYRPAVGPGTVGVSSFFDKRGAGGDSGPRLPSRRCSAILRRSGIRRVLVGHKPCGDFPLCLVDWRPAGGEGGEVDIEVEGEGERTGGAGGLVSPVVYIDADTSYSGGSGRGANAVFDVHLCGPSASECSARVVGVRDDGSPLAFCSDGEANRLFGQRLAGGWWVRAAQRDPERPGRTAYLLTRWEGYTVREKTVLESQL